MSVTLLQDTATPLLTSLATALRPGRRLPFAVALAAGAFPARRSPLSALSAPALRRRSILPAAAPAPSALGPLALSPADLLDALLA